MKKIGRLKDFRERLEEACEGLIYVSESDASVETFFCTEGKVVAAGELSPLVEPSKRRHVEETTVDRFFEKLTRDREWFGPAEKKRAKQFASLRSLLEENLTGLKVFRFGKIRIDIFVAGIDKDKRLAGVRTRAVET